MSMGKIDLIIVILVAALVVHVESQKACSDSNECQEGYCCGDDGECFLDSLDLGCNPNCFDDLSCTNGCCVKFKCEPQTSYQCIEKNRCSRNSECDSDCCKNNKCQATSIPCIFDGHKCSSKTDCIVSSSGKCCVDGKCTDCTYGKYIFLQPNLRHGNLVVAKTRFTL